jgi:hypothetical protein
MSEMDSWNRTRFQDLHASGMAAKNAGEHGVAFYYFQSADDLARQTGDENLRLNALNPMARALWSMDACEEAQETLDEAQDIAERLGLVDERAIAISNMGRMAARKTVRRVPVRQRLGAFKDRTLGRTAIFETGKTVPVRRQAAELRRVATPRFEEAYELLRGHDHLYFRYANATHGSIVAALAGERALAETLIDEGQTVSNEVSPEPYDMLTPAQISPDGLKLLKAARYLIPLGNRTPGLAFYARRRLIR